jgi:hypothetical protein
MTLNQNTSPINPDHITDYLYDNAIVDAAGFIDIHDLIRQLRADYGETDYFTPDNNPDSPFCVAVYLRATQHNSARLAELTAQAEPDANPEPEPVGSRDWLLPVTCLVALLIPFAMLFSSLVAVAALVG